MKEYISNIMAFALMLITMLSCQKEEVSRVGFNSAFSANSQGMTSLEVNCNKGKLFFSANLFVNEGSIEIILLNPESMLVYQQIFSSPGLYNFSESFPVVPGFWKLSYKSHSGSGNINIYLSNNYGS